MTVDYMHIDVAGNIAHREEKKWGREEDMEPANC